MIQVYLVWKNWSAHFCPLLIYFVILPNLTSDWACPNCSCASAEVGERGLRTVWAVTLQRLLYMDKESRNQPQLEVSSTGHMWNFSTRRSPGAEKLSLACSGHARPRMYAVCWRLGVCVRPVEDLHGLFVHPRAPIFENADLHLGGNNPAPSQVLLLQGAAHFLCQ